MLMVFIKKLCLWLSSGIFKSTLVLLAMVSAVIVTLGTPVHIKNALKTSNVYGSIVDTLLEQAKKSTEKSSDGEIPISDPIIQNAAKTAFSPAFLESSAEQIIDGTYRWLDGTSAKPDFRIDLLPAKQTFIKSVADNAGQKITALPVCGKQQQKVNLDLFQATCRQIGLNIALEQQKLINAFNSNADFLPNTVISVDSLPKDEQGQNAFDKIVQAPKGYQFSKKTPWLLGLSATLFGALVVFIHKTRRRGLRSIAISLLGIGIVLEILSFVINYLFQKAISPTGSLGKTLQNDSFQLSLARAFDSLIRLFTWRLVWFGIVYATAGIIILLVLKFVWKQQPVKNQENGEPPEIKKIEEKEPADPSPQS